MRHFIDIVEAADKAFENWFAGSKVVDEHGAPLVVYHGGSSWRVAPGVTWFTDDPAVADGYADQGYGDPEIKACYLRIEKPLDLRDARHIELAFPDGFAEYVHPAYADRDAVFALRTSREAIRHAIDYAQQHGYDGVIHPDTNVQNRGHHTAYVIFSPNQVKAAEFQGWEDDLIYGDHARHGGKAGFSRDSDDIMEDE